MKKALVLLVILATLVGTSVLVYTLLLGKRNVQSSIDGTTVSTKQNKNNTHIFMCADDGNAMPTCTTIASVLSNSASDENINVHIVSFDDNHMSEENIKRIEKLGTTIKKFNLDFTYFDKKRLSKFNTNHWNKAILVKLFGAQLFPNLDKIIWLDDDVIVLKSLNNIYNKDMDDKYLFGVDVSSEYNKYNGRDCPYWITAGFGLYNLKEIRKDDFQKDLLNFAKSYPVNGHSDKKYCGGIEEYALTKIPKDKVNVLPYKYSVMCSMFGGTVYENLDLEDCVVLHYAACKPWRDKKYISKKYLDVWEKYFYMTEYSKELKGTKKAA